MCAYENKILGDLLIASAREWGWKNNGNIFFSRPSRSFSCYALALPRWFCFQNPLKEQKREGKKDKFLARIQVFSIEGSNRGDAKGGPPCRGVRGHSRPENFEMSSPRKRDFRHSEAKSACFNVSFFKVKMPFFLLQNITKLSRNDANLRL